MKLPTYRAASFVCTPSSSHTTMAASHVVAAPRKSPANTTCSSAASDDARRLGVPVEYFGVVYDAVESVESRMQEVLSPTPDGEYVGSAVVQEVFNIGGTGNVAGSRCRDGMIRKGSNVRVMRGDRILRESKVRTLRNFKAEVDSVNAGDECGIGLLDFEDFLPGDIIKSFVV